MAEEQVQKLLQAAAQAARSGNKDQARKAFLYVLKLQPENEAAWLGLVTVAQDKKEQLAALKKVLEINPNNQRAQEALRRLMPEKPAPAPPPTPPITPAPIKSLKSLKPIAPSAAPTESPAAIEPPPMTFDAPVAPRADKPLFSEVTLPQGVDGVPMPNPKKLAQAADAADKKIQAYLQQTFEDIAGIQWVQKNRNRAGEREITVLRLQIATGVITFLLVIGLMGFAAVLNIPEVRELIFAPTWTVSPTPTFTPTNTPGVTPTPSPTLPVTPTPTPTLPFYVTPGNALREFAPTATRIYLPQGVSRERRIEQADAAYNNDDLETTYNLLEQERIETLNSGNFLPFYYLVRWHLRQDDPETARTLLIDGEERWRNGNQRDANFEPMVNAAYAQIELYEAAQRLNAGEELSELQQELSRAGDYAQLAIDSDPNFVEGHLLLAERHRLANDYEAALQVLSAAQLTNRDLFLDTRLRLALAKIYSEQGRYTEARQAIEELHYIDPFNEEGWRLQVVNALASGDPGLAISYTDKYLYYYPNSLEAYKLRGDAHLREDKPDEALIDYAVALQGDPNDPAYVDVLVARAELYSQRGRYDLALADLTNALEIAGDNAAIRANRMFAAYFNGDTQTALADAAALSGRGVIREEALALLQAQIQIDRAAPDDVEVYRTALNQLLNIAPERLPVESLPTRDEYIAQAQYALGSYNEALNAINRAIEAGETGKRRYLRGLIYQARADANSAMEDYAAARLEYDFVLTWSSIYPFSFVDDAQERYTVVTEQLEALRAAEAESS